MTALSVDLTDPFTTWYKIAVLQLGRRWFSVSCSKFCGLSLVGMICWPVSGEGAFWQCILLPLLGSLWWLHCCAAHRLSSDQEEVGSN